MYNYGSWINVVQLSIDVGILLLVYGVKALKGVSCYC